MKRVILGKPFDSQAVVNFNNIKDVSVKELPDFLKIENSDKFKLSFHLNKTDIVYGLGENVRGINKRGGLYKSFCSDDFSHTPDKSSLYAAHNFVLIDGETPFGLFIDHPGLVNFDIGYTDKNIVEITADNPELNLFYIPGDSLLSIVKEFRYAIGQSYIPPKWAFGFQQSRWSYPTAEAIKDVADSFIKNDIPCDTIYMDIDYMEDYKNFTVDRNKFPNFNLFVKEMKGKGFRLIPIIDAGCKIEKDYPIYEEGVENGYYCVDKDGKPFVGAVWPGRVHFPDFLNKDASQWFGKKYDFLIDQGIEGFWNDMNEPAIFYSEKGLEKALEKVSSYAGKNLGINEFFDLKSTIGSISNSVEDYKSFYHNINGKLINHYDVHNMYGYFMTKAAGESFQKNHSDKRILLFSRSSAVGMHRYSGIWTGDNKSWWEHLLLNIKMMPSLSMVGFLYSGADVGGFGANADSELVTRWSQFAIFAPLFRNHSALGTRSQEPFSFDSDTTGILRNILKLRYALIPFIYSEFLKAVLENSMLFKPLSFEFDDSTSKRVEDQLLFGDSLMLAPIYEANSFGRNIWLPEDMLMWKVSDYRSIETKLIKEGWNYIDVELEETPLFIRKDKALIIGEHNNNVDSLDSSKLTLIAYVYSKAEYKFSNDDGISYSYKTDKIDNSTISVLIENNKVNISVDIPVKGLRELNYHVADSTGKVYTGSISFK